MFSNNLLEFSHGKGHGRMRGGMMGQGARPLPLLAKHILAHIGHFMEMAALYPPPGGKSLVGVSGGADSMFLAWVVGQLLRARRCPPPVWVHINHATRSACGWEETQVLRWAQKCGSQVKVFRLSPTALVGASNFEARARQVRRTCFRQALGEFGASTLYLGHTIDDSFEWYLRQQFRSSQWPATPGIPLVHGSIKRPLHCMSRRQIEHLVDTLGIPHCLDGSNLNQRFERNFIRHGLVGKIARRYPAYLKHYVVKANQMAAQQSRSALAVDPQPHCLEDALGGKCLLQTLGGGHFRGQEVWIKRVLSKVSRAGRGRIRLQVQKLIDAQIQGKRGPMHLSGGVHIFMGPGSLLVLGAKQLEDYRRWDARAAEYIEGIFEMDMPELLWNPKHWELRPRHLVAPFWVLGSSPRAKGFLPPAKRAHPLFPQFFSACSQNRLWVRPLGQVLVHARKRRLNPRDFGLVPFVMF